MAVPEVDPASAAVRSDLERLQTTCRRQAAVIDTLRAAIAQISDGARALKAENAELRADAARLRGDRRTSEHGGDRIEGAELAEVPIPVGPDAPAAARGLIVRCLDDRVPHPVLENVKLVTSELVTNSVRHSGIAEGDHVIVRVHHWRGMCRLEVEDPGCGGVIAPRPPRAVEGSGMGLQLVQMLSERWGVIRGAAGPTRVWGQLSCAEDSG